MAKINRVVVQRSLFGNKGTRLEETKSALVAKYIIPPFSVFDTKQGYWQERRKRRWRAAL